MIGLSPKLLRHLHRVRRGADDVAQRLHRGAAVDVGDHLRARVLLRTPRTRRAGSRRRASSPPRGRAPRRSVRVQDLRRLGHEVDAAERDHVAVAFVAACASCERVADEVREVLDLGLLVVVGEEDRVALFLERADRGLEIVRDLRSGGNAGGRVEPCPNLAPRIGGRGLESYGSEERERRAGSGDRLRVRARPRGDLRGRTGRHGAIRPLAVEPHLSHRAAGRSRSRVRRRARRRRSRSSTGDRPPARSALPIGPGRELFQGFLGLAFHPTTPRTAGSTSTTVRARPRGWCDTSGLQPTRSRRPGERADRRLGVTDRRRPHRRDGSDWTRWIFYWQVGDGGYGGYYDASNYAQSTTGELLGNVLRIDVDRDDFPSDANRNYGFPRTTRSSARPARMRSGPSACATPIAEASTVGTATTSSRTSARTTERS